MSKTSLLSKTKLKHPKAIIKTYSNDLSGSFAVTLAELFERKCLRIQNTGMDKLQHL